MASTRLPNYLLSHRKRLALTQKEVAFLMGRSDATKLSAYELFKQMPTLETALALEAIYGSPVGELFSGLRESIGEEIAKRAKVMSYRVAFRKDDVLSQKRRAALTLLRSAASNESK
jgi:transcriptional regulator with XRE-family HTH domain